MIASLYIDAVQILPEDDLSVGGLLSISGLGSPSPRREVISRARSHGEIDMTQYYSGRVLSLAGFTYGPDMATANSRFDTLKAALQLGTDHTLKFTRIGQPEEMVLCRVASSVDSSMEGASQIVKWAVDLFAPDPRIYASALQTVSYFPSAGGVGEGIDFDIDFPISFPGAVLTSMSATNAGTFPTSPVFTITGPVTNPIIDNITSGLSLYTQGLVMNAGDQVVVDMAARTLSIAGVVRMDYVDSSQTNWFDLIPGSNNLRLRGSSVSAGITALSVSFRDARI